MGVISPGDEKVLDFLKLGQVLSSYDRDLRDLLWWPQLPARLHTSSWAPASMGEESLEAPGNSHAAWPFLRPPERVPEALVVSREHLPQVEKIQEVLPSRRDEAHFG